jgi:phosphopantothenoylcysteine decarboxylase/phosphopantothenate--cysteine ligase
MSRLLLGVSGGVAAYKALETGRLAVKAGHAVRVIQTPASQRFVGPASFEAITGAPVLVTEWDSDPMRGAFPGDREPPRAPISHLALAQRADLYLIAPATANTLAKLAHGHADNLLTAAALAVDCPVLVAPAMNDRMYRHPATQANIAILADRGVVIIGPGEGELASHGEHGVGRLSEPVQLLEAVEAVLGVNADGPSWTGIRVLVTAGGTREPIDSVRYIGNRSSGRMGVALAAQAARRGAEVTLVAANLAVPAPPGVQMAAVRTAAEMKAACETVFPECDVVLMAAAVADFRPAGALDHKLKKHEVSLPASIELEATDDILLGLAARRRADQVLVGFAAEHGERAVAYGRKKLAQKGVDMVVVNDISRPDIGFDSEANEVVIVTATGEHRVPRAGKDQIADAVLDAVARRWEEAHGGARARTGSVARD